jgi:two-component system sensor histidine kinase RegB
VQQLENERLLALGIQAASAAHALGTPLSTIAIIAGELRHEVGSLQTNDDLPMPAFLDEELAVIEEQVALCKSALDRMGRQSSSGPSTAPVSLAQWFEDFLERWRLRCPATRIQSRMAQIGMPVAEAETLGQILTTLLDNAAEAVKAEDGVVVATLEIAGQAAQFRISDAGPGIAADLLPLLGYRQVDSKTGRGIGLLLAFASARRIGAEIGIESPPGQGTCATLRLAS